MKTVEWQMKEDFVFPSSAGLPTGSETIKVTPRFTITRSADAVRLTGIYHIAANISLNAEASGAAQVENAILVDDVEIQDEKGYFEYAVPLHIDLPAEVKDPLKVLTTEVACEPYGQGAFSIVWQVECSYQEVASASEAPQAEQAVENTTAEKQKQTVKGEEKQEEKIAKAEKQEAVNQNKDKSKAATAEKVKADAETTVAQSEQQSDLAQNEEKAAVAQVEKEVAVTAAVSVIEDTTFSDSDDALSFIAGLDDGVSSTLFRSNDVAMQTKS